MGCFSFLYTYTIIKGRPNHSQLLQATFKHCEHKRAISLFNVHNSPYSINASPKAIGFVPGFPRYRVACFNLWPGE